MQARHSATAADTSRRRAASRARVDANVHASWSRTVAARRSSARFPPEDDEKEEEDDDDIAARVGGC